MRRDESEGSSDRSTDNSPQFDDCTFLQQQSSQIKDESYRRVKSTGASSPIIRNLNVSFTQSTDSPPILLSPVLSRPVRSLSAIASYPLLVAASRTISCDSESDLSTVWQRRNFAQTPPRCSSPSASNLARKSSSKRPSRPGGASNNGIQLSRCESDVGDRPRTTATYVRRRPSNYAAHNLIQFGISSQTSMTLSASQSNLLRLRITSLGHSDPQIFGGSKETISPNSTAQPLSYPAVKFRKELRSGFANRRTSNRAIGRRSFNAASTSPVLPNRRRSPSQQSTSRNAPFMAPGPSHGRTHSIRSASNLMMPIHPDTRRWSLASLPSSSGYGTPGTGSNSAFSSQYSSQEHLAELLNDLRVGQQRFDSNDSYSGCPEECVFRPRSRSLNSPVKFGSDSASEVGIRNNLYKERFPKAKNQMEERLLSFIEQNGPLSGVCVESTERSATVGKRISRVESSENSDLSVVRLIADGATRFIHRQIVEMAVDCLNKSRDDLIASTHFCDMSQRLEDTLNEAYEKTSTESFLYLSKLVKQLLMIVSRPARLLECLEFDPDEFYQLLEEAEDAVREQLGSGSARVPDLPQYIVSKLGLDRDPLMEIENTASAAFNSSVGFAFVDDANEEAATPEGKNKGNWPENRCPSEEDFDHIRLVSNGAYGAVYLVRHRESRQRYALKKMNKQTLILRNQIEQVYAERDILTFTDNPFVVSFYGSFETKQQLCMLMEYVEGGDCAALLKNAGTLPSDLVRLYVAETILAIEYLHSYGIVHRDLKPDNLLITAMGHIKLTDFGLSKIGLMNRTTLVCEGYMDVSETQQFKDKQLCGTPEYIAPEVILRQGYGKPVDWWALGVIMYEFLIGVVPFMGDTPEELFANVISEEIEYPTGDEQLPDEAEDLIRRLCEKNPMERLGTLTDAAEVYVHPFFSRLNFNSLLRRKAEFVPQLENDEDTSYFDTRTDRYNHDGGGAESGDDDCSNSLMFWSFNTASPRHSVVAIADTATLLSNQQPTTADKSDRNANAQSEESNESGIGWHQSVDSDPADLTANPTSSAAHSSQRHSNDPIPTAVLLRRRFSTQRYGNVSTSTSSGAGTPNLNTSSTDSSMDASYIPVSTILDDRKTLPRFAISCDPDEHSHADLTKELSPVDERQTSTELRMEEESESSKIPSLQLHQSNCPTPSTTTNAPALRLVIPSNSTTAATTTTTVNNPAIGYIQQISPGGSSTSSVDGSGMHSNTLTTNLNQSASSGTELSPQIQSLKAPIIIKKGAKGFGFTIKSVRVYLGEDSDYYTIQHMVTEVDNISPAYEAGLRTDDLITHVNGEPVQNLTHPQLMHRLLAFGNELNLKVTPIANTTIKEGAARRSAGKLAKKKPKRPARRVAGVEKKSRKSSSLFRRLSGKRTSTEIAPGSSLQKQTFMPRSISSQEGILPILAASSTQICNMPIPAVQHKRLSDVGLRAHHHTDENLHHSPLVIGTSTTLSTSSSNRPSTLAGLKHKVAGMAQHLTPAGRKHHSHTVSMPMPVSPLARQEGNLSPTRSPSPLASRMLAACSSSKIGGSKKTVTRPRKSDVGLLATSENSEIKLMVAESSARKYSVGQNPIDK